MRWITSKKVRLQTEQNQELVALTDLTDRTTDPQTDRDGS